MDQLTHTVRRSNWINIIRQCQDRPAGTTAKQWLTENDISEKSYYYWLRKIRREVCEQEGLQEAANPSALSFVEIPVKTALDTAPVPTVPAAMTPVAVIRSGRLTLELSNDISESLLCRRCFMLEDAAGIRRVVIACGYVDLRKGIDGLSMIIGDRYHQNPFEKGTLFLFCGRRSDRIKGLLWMAVSFSSTNGWGRFPVLAENQRRSRRPYRGTVPLSYDGAESPEPQSQGSNTAKAHLIFVQNIDFLCLSSGQIHSQCYSLSEGCFMVCDVSTGGSG